MKCTFINFDYSKKYEGRIILYVLADVIDELTGVPYREKQHYLLVGKFYLEPFVGKQVDITLTKSPKLGFNVCTNIKLVTEDVDSVEPVELF